jgi:DNA-binding SARP family transcriptional activator
MRFRLLGPLDVSHAGRPVPVGGPKVRALLAVLLLGHGRTVTPGQLSDALWGDEPPEGRGGLHYLVHRLRRQLGEAGDAEVQLRTREGGYQLDLPEGAVDLDRFEELVARARRSGTAEAAILLEEALALWQGPPLAGLPATPWLDAQAARLDARHADAVEAWADAKLALGQGAELVGELQARVPAWPLRERLRGQLMVALYRAGRQADALAAFRTARATLVDELGIEPGPELVRLQHAILNNDPALHPVVEPPAVAAAPPSPPAPARPAPVRAEQVRKVVTVAVFGLETQGDEDGPEDVATRLAGGLATAKQEIERYGGTITASAGSMAMAIFGTSRAHDDDPERAVRAVLVLRDKRGPGGPLLARAGLATGEALLTSRHGVLEPAGTVVDSASALYAAAGPGQVLIGPSLRLATRRTIEHLALDHDRWLAVGPLARTKGTEPSPDAPLIERGHELRLLAGLLDRARREHEPQLATLIGAPGIGKSRLVAELGRIVEADPELIAWRQGRSLPYGDGVTFWALAEIVKAETGILETDPAGDAGARLRDAVEATLGAGDTRDAVWMARHLGALVVPGDSGETTNQRTEMFAAWRRFLEGVAARRPLVLVFEDLHWADDALLDFIDELAEQTSGALLVICTARPELLERRAGWGGGKRNATTISLPPLSAPGTGELLDTLLAGRRLPGPVRDSVVVSAGGNPLFVEEYVRMLGDPGSVGPSGRVGVPATVGQVITARIDTLDDTDRTLLQDAAVLGETGWVGAVAAIGGVDRDQAEGWLRRLERRELLRRTSSSAVGGEIEYGFRHALVRDVAYAQLPRARRADRHRRAADWIGSLSPDRAADRAELLAHHFGQALAYTTAAGQPTGDLPHLARLAQRDAGDRAVRLGAHDVAVRFYESALELWDRDDQELPDLLLRLGTARVQTSREGPAMLYLARDGFLTSGLPTRAAEAEIRAALAVFRARRNDELRDCVRRAIALVAGEPASKAKSEVLSYASNFMTVIGDRRAMAVALEAERIAREIGDRTAEARALIPVGLIKGMAGDPSGAGDIRRAISLFGPADRQLDMAWNNLAAVLSWAGDLRGSFAAFSESSRITRRNGGGSEYDRVYLEVELTSQKWWEGHWAEAAATAGRVAATVGTEPQPLASVCHLILGRVALAGGDPAAAARHVEPSLEEALISEDPFEFLPSKAFGARVLAELGRTAEARLLLEGLLAGLAGELLPAEVGADLPFALATLDGPGALARLDAARVRPSLWLDAALAWLAGDRVGAAGLYARIGSRPDEAWARTQAGADLLAAGDREGAAAQLEAALAFWAEVGATGAAAEARALLDRT